VLRKAAEFLNKHKIKWWLMGGSALGAVREGNHIEHDKDVDIGIAPEQSHAWDLLLKEFGFPLYRKWTYRDQYNELSFKKYGTKIDFFFCYQKGQRYWYGAFGPDKFGRWGKHSEFLPRSFPKSVFEPPKKLRFREADCYLPRKPEKFVESMYGQDWRVVKKAWKYWKDCKALDLSLVDKEINVFIFDAWDKIGDTEKQILHEAKRFGNRLIAGILTDEALIQAKTPSKNPFETRLKYLKTIKIIDKIIKIDSLVFAKSLQKINLVPDYFIAFELEDARSVEWLKIFGCEIIPIEKIKESLKSKIKIRKRKSRKDMIAVCIKTFMREENFFRAVDMVEKNFPYPHRFYIADDGNVSEEKEQLYRKLENSGHKIIRLPFNSGLSVGRNALIKEAAEDYVLIMDDDIGIKSPETIKNMRRVLDSKSDIGIVAGVLKHEITDRPFGNGNYSRGIDLIIKDNILHRYTTRNSTQSIDGIRYVQSDQVINFFLAKREVFNSVKWDSNIKIGWEHMDFFLSLKKTPWKAVICLDAEAMHFHPLPHDFDYQYYRRSGAPNYFLNKHGFVRQPINHWATEGIKWAHAK